jgi:hypothetical protein
VVISELSDRELRRLGRAILQRPALAGDARRGGEQAAILAAWVRRRWPLQLTPTERVELGIARQLIQDLSGSRRR